MRLCGCVSGSSGANTDIIAAGAVDQAVFKALAIATGSEQFLLKSHFKRGFHFNIYSALVVRIAPTS